MRNGKTCPSHDPLRSLTNPRLPPPDTSPSSLPVQRLGINHQGYFGENIDVPAFLDTFRRQATRSGWTVDSLPAAPDRPLLTAFRPAQSPPSTPLRFYLSAGIHGDEPAAPLALLELIRADLLPHDADVWLCPCLNPSGLQAGTRNSADGIDLNRDYNHVRSPEVAAHIRWLSSLPPFDLSLLLHEDWESAGFYLYELNPDRQTTAAPTIINAVRSVCPIETAQVIDGRPTQAPGIILPPADPSARPDWPEAFWLLQNQTRHNITLEAPSDFPLATRIAALTTASLSALDLARSRPSDFLGQR